MDDLKLTQWCARTLMGWSEVPMGALCDLADDGDDRALGLFAVNGEGYVFIAERKRTARAFKVVWFNPIEDANAERLALKALAAQGYVVTTRTNENADGKHEVVLERGVAEIRSRPDASPGRAMLIAAYMAMEGKEP